MRKNVWDMDDETKPRVGMPPKTDHEQKAAKEALQEVTKELKKAAAETYADELRQIVEIERTARMLKKEVDEGLKRVGMTREQLNKLL